jgi:hypothetical protein
MSHTQGDLEMKTLLIIMLVFLSACESENDDHLSGPGSYDPECYEMCIDNFRGYYELVYNDTGNECMDKFTAWKYVYDTITNYFKDLKYTSVYDQLGKVKYNSYSDECDEVEDIDTELFLNKLILECAKSYC